jgi:hypothetical protein
MLRERKFFYIIIFVITTILVVIPTTLDFSHLQKAEQTANKNISIDDGGRIGFLQFKKFLPLYVAHGGNVIWYSIVPQTGDFEACSSMEDTIISFFVTEPSPVFEPIFSIDIINGLTCEDSQCHYKTIRLIAGQKQCLFLEDSFAKSPEDIYCGRFYRELLSLGSYYSVYSNVKVRYIISCCPKGVCVKK